MYPKRALLQLLACSLTHSCVAANSRSAAPSHEQRLTLVVIQADLLDQTINNCMTLEGRSLLPDDCWHVC